LCRNYKGNHHGLVITGQPYFKVLPDNSDILYVIFLVIDIGFLG